MTLTLKTFSGQLTFDGATCRLTYPSGWKSGYLRRVLGERVIPVTALSGVDSVPPPRSGTPGCGCGCAMGPTRSWP
jgi:hypothetical protein